MIQFLTRQLAAFIIVLLCALQADTAQAQNSRFDVEGVVVDSAGTGLPGATVVALTRADSILTKFATTNRDGAFTLRRLPVGDYILQVTFVGFQTLRRDFDVGDADVDVGTVALEASVAELDELVVSADHIPFVIKRDTLDYNANAFETRPNAVVEDLLRRLPGIEVEDDGTITAQGEEVKNVLVEGKEFFGKDPTVATQNLPADAVERVQVYDKQSDKAEFTGIPDGEEEKTINLELKEEAKRGVVGNVRGGLGNEGTEQALYDGKANINRFSPTTQLAAIANANNVNQSGSGFGRTLEFGPNVSHDFASKSWIRSSYYLSSVDKLQDRVVQRQELLGSEVAALVNQINNQTSDNLRHRINLNAQVTFSEGHDLRFRGNLTANASSLTSSNLQETADATGVVQNTATTQHDTEGDNLEGSAQLTWRKRLTERGRSIVAQARANLNDDEFSSDLASTLAYYNRGDSATSHEILQRQAQKGQTLNQTLRLSLTEPLGRGRVVELFGERTTLNEDQSKAIFDIEDGNLIYNDLLSSGFDRTYTYLRGGLQFSRNTKKSWIGFGANVQNAHLDAAVMGEDDLITNRFTHLLPWAILNFNLDDGKNLKVHYRTSTREPSVEEIQPFVDNSDPLNIYIGNPELTPEYRQSIEANYRFFDQFSFVNLFLSAGVSYIQDKIVSSRFANEQLQQVFTSVNSDGAWSTNGHVAFGAPLRAIGAKFTINNRVTYSRGIEFVNEAKNTSRILSDALEFGLENRVKEVFDIRVRARMMFNKVDYSLNRELNLNYINTTYSMRGNYYLGTAWTFGTTFNYQVYDKEVFGTDQNIALLNASISRLMKDKRTEIELVAVDLLNQNQGINITNAPNYVQNERIETLGRYLMLEVIHRLSGPMRR